MELNQYDLYAYQLLHYLVIRQHYQVVRVEQFKDDFWLMNASSDKYPVIRISSRSNAGTRSDTDYVRNVHRMILNLIHREGRMMILNTNPDSKPIDNEVLKQVRMLPYGEVNEELLQTFDGLEHVIHQVADPEKEFIQLSKEVEEIQLKRRKELLEKVSKKRIPRVTIGIIVFCICYAIAAYLLLFLIQDVNIASIAAGAYYKMNVVAAHEYFRLLTAGFLHMDPISLCVHLYALYLVGKYTEQLFTRKEYLLILFLSILTGNLCMLIGSPNGIGMGIGGGIYGLLGAYLTLLIKNGSIHHPLIKISLLPVVVAALFTMVLPGISIEGHIGGLFTGVLLAMALDKNGRHQELRPHARIALAMLGVALVVFAANVKRVEPLAQDVDNKVIEVYHHTPMQGYGDYLKGCYQAQYEKE